MTESIRKKNKARNTPTQTILACEADVNSLRFISSHATKPSLFDATVFAEGRTLPERAHGWDKGGHSGRPKLTVALMPHIRSRYGAAPQKTLIHLHSAMRAWWRLFDKYTDIKSVEDIEDIDELVHGALAHKEDFTNGTSAFLVVLNDARRARNLHPLDIRLPRRSPQHTSLPDQKHINAIATALTRTTREMFTRWKQADEIIAEMSGWHVASSGWTPGHWHGSFNERHAHCAYRQACVELGNPVVRRDQYVAWLGLQNTENYNNPFVAGFPAAVSGLYPNRKQSAHLLYLFLCKTGWNLQTALDIDVDNYWRPHPTNKSFAIIYAAKDRANGDYQRAASEVKPKLSAYNLLVAVIARTEPLREQLKKELNQLERLKEAYPNAANEETDFKINELKRCIRSPWLHVITKESSPISALNNRVIYESEQRLSTLIAEINTHRNKDDQIDSSIKIGDFRDAYISAQYRRSNYSWIVAHLAAGHKNMQSLVHYLRKRQWKAHGERTIYGFTTALWDEIRATNAIDPAILHALVQRGEVTEEQRQRWANHKDRTRVGTGCKDFNNPPKSLAPEHISGEGCRIQRCTLCPNAVIFEDSMDALARRLAQLHTIKENIPLPSWYDSSWPTEAESTERILYENWDATSVDSRISYWRKQVTSAIQTLLALEGEYAA
jgi:hypothetical protein